MHLKPHCLGALALIGLMLPVTPASAVKLPAGDWGHSCSQTSMKGFIITSTCKRKDGSSNTTQLDLLTCAQPPVAQNVDGTLRCPGPRKPLLGGSWSKWCGLEVIFDDHDNHRHFGATCYDTATNTPHSVSILLEICHDPVRLGFQSGKLYCESGPKSAEQRLQQQREQSQQQPQAQGTTSQRIIIQPGNQTVVPLIEGLGIIFGVQP